MKKVFQLCFLYFWIFAATIVQAQKFIENPSFEEYIECPENVNQLSNCKGWSTTDIYSSPEYFNECSMYNPYTTRVGVPVNFQGCRKAQDGKGYIGMIVFDKEDYTFREYIQTKLLLRFKAGNDYRISAFVSLSDSSMIPADHLSFCFSKDRKLTIDIMAGPLCSCKNRSVVNNMELVSQKQWVMISAEFVATGDELYLTIGSFREDYSKKDFQKKAKKYKKTGSGYKNNNNYTYLYVDNLVLTDITSDKNTPPSGADVPQDHP